MSQLEATQHLKALLVGPVCPCCPVVCHVQHADSLVTEEVPITFSCQFSFQHSSYRAQFKDKGPPETHSWEGETSVVFSPRLEGLSSPETVNMIDDLTGLKELSF